MFSDVRMEKSRQACRGYNRNLKEVHRLVESGQFQYQYPDHVVSVKQLKLLNV